MEFNLGYGVSAVLSICFVTLGAFLCFGIPMPGASASFANKVIELYTHTIGDWSYFIIAVAAFSIMFGTSIGVFDGYARALERTTELLFFEEKAQKMLYDRKVYIFSLIVLAIGAYAIIYYFHDKAEGFKTLVDIATTLSFLISPLIAIVNYKLVTGKAFHKTHKPGKILRVLSWAGMVFLTIFSVVFLTTFFL